MYRTPEQEREYQNLSSDMKRRYDYEVSTDPTISHSQAMQLAKLSDILHGDIKKGIDVDTTKPEIKRSILQRLGDFLSIHAPSVWRNVRDTFTKAINYLGDLIWRGIEFIDDYVVSPIVEFLDDIFG